jgi:hypothetical protein
MVLVFTLHGLNTMLGFHFLFNRFWLHSYKTGNRIAMQSLKITIMTNTPKGTKTIALNNALKAVELLAQKQNEIKEKTQIFERSLRSLNDDISRIKEEIKINSFLHEYGWFYVGVSSTDCDCVQSYYVRKFQSIKRFYRFCDSVMSWAEGPTSISIITKGDYDEERQHPTRSRDRIMEAYENGNGRSIVV